MNQDVRALEAQYIVPTYRRTPIVLVRGAGSRVFDDEGREYLDLIAGQCAPSGHGHGATAGASTAGRASSSHFSTCFHPCKGQLMSVLSNCRVVARLFFCNSGTEAVEACLASRDAGILAAQRAQAGRRPQGSFHGRTFGSLSVTFDEHYRAILRRC